MVFTTSKNCVRSTASAPPRWHACGRCIDADAEDVLEDRKDAGRKFHKGSQAGGACDQFRLEERRRPEGAD